LLCIEYSSSSETADAVSELLPLLANVANQLTSYGECPIINFLSVLKHFLPFDSY